MAKLQTVKRTARGLYGQFNPVTQIPEGGLLEALDVVIDREGVVGKRRGFKRYATLAATARALLEFQDRLVALEGTTLKYDSDGDGAMSAWSGSFSPPDSSTRMRAIEARRNLYFTSSEGVKKNDALTRSPVQAGMPQALDHELTLSGTGGGWFTHNRQVAYQVAWSKTDFNNFLVRGEPSYKETLTNPITAVTLAASGSTVTVTHTAHGYATGDEVEISGVSDAAYENGSHTITVTGANTYTYTVAGTPPATGTASAGKDFDVEVKFTVPDGIVAGDYYEVYRSEMSASATTDPGERLYEVVRKKVTQTQIDLKVVTLTDNYDPVFLGDEIYTSPFQEGVAQGNTRPPFAKDLALFKGHVFYANTRREHFLELQILDENGFDAGLGMAGFFDGILATIGSWFDFTSATYGSITFTIGSSTLKYNYGATENISTRTFRVYSSELTEAENIRKTARSLVRVINRDTGNSLLYAFYTSGADDPPGKILIRARTLAVAQFSVTASSTGIGDNWSPELPVSGTAVESDNESTQNNLVHSKFEQPEAVPRANESPVGSEQDAILRILALRDSLIILTDGPVFRLSGDDEQSFTVRELDPSTKLLCPESAVVLDNSVYCVSTQGVVRINESGTAIVSRPIEEDFKRIYGFPDYQTLIHAAAHESERKYFLWTPSESGDTNTPLCWTYNYITEAWTKWRKKAACALVISGDEMLYAGHAVDSFILSERKHGSTYEDYRDEDIDATVTATGTTTDSDGNTVSTVTLTYTYTGTAMAKGFLFRQSGEEARVTAVTVVSDTSFTVTLDKLLSPAAGAATVSIPIVSEIRWAPDAVGNVAVAKQFTFCQIYMQEDSATRHEIGFFSDVVSGRVFLQDITVPNSYGWGNEAWGASPWGGSTVRTSTPIRVPVPRQFQRARTLSVIYRHRMCKERFEILQLSLTARPYGERTVVER